MKLVISCCVVIALAACSHKSGSGPDAPATCGVFGTACAGNGDCCSNDCGSNGMCDSNPSVCGAGGDSCSANTDCCTTSCINNICSANQCTADGQTCGNDGECCSGSCNGSCQALNANCKSEGNPCTAGGDCCSKFCTANGTCGNSSYCVQNGDACAHDADCCGGICNPGPGGLGTCTQPEVGATNCSAGMDGTVCGGCGDCCSRLCAPFANTGVMVCQPAEGCRIDGDLCKSDSDCCGAPGSNLPGDGNVHCIREQPTDPVGVCRNPTGCDPEGDICHFKDYGTCGNSSARNDCCAAPGNSGVCQLDANGVPRCYGLGTMCQQVGQSCSNSLDCCNGEPCVSDGMGHLVCGSMCSATNGPCTSSADCCPGGTCIIQQGSTMGSCSATTTCSQSGQACSDTMPCCDMLSCNVTGSDPVMTCPAGQMGGCTCFAPIF